MAETEHNKRKHGRVSNLLFSLKSRVTDPNICVIENLCLTPESQDLQLNSEVAGSDVICRRPENTEETDTCTWSMIRI